MTSMLAFLLGAGLHLAASQGLPLVQPMDGSSLLSAELQRDGEGTPYGGEQFDAREMAGWVRLVAQDEITPALSAQIAEHEPAAYRYGDPQGFDHPQAALADVLLGRQGATENLGGLSYALASSGDCPAARIAWEEGERRAREGQEWLDAHQAPWPKRRDGGLLFFYGAATPAVIGFASTGFAAQVICLGAEQAWSEHLHSAPSGRVFANDIAATHSALSGPDRAAFRRSFSRAVGLEDLLYPFRSRELDDIGYSEAAHAVASLSIWAEGANRDGRYRESAQAMETAFRLFNRVDRPRPHAYALGHLVFSPI